MIRVMIGAAEQSVAYDLRTAVEEMEGAELLFVVESTTELVPAVMRLDPDVLLVHDRLGPDPVLQTVRDLSLRRPSCASLMVTGAQTSDQLSDAMAAGARGTVPYPLNFVELQGRVLASGDWAQQMRRMISVPGSNGHGTGPRRGRVIAYVGAKGGTGTTTIATHTALDVVRNVPGHRVCLVDLDLEKGDVGGILEVRHRASVADLAKVAQDLGPQAVGDAVVVHESGLHLLLPPSDVREVEVVSPPALREVMAALRQEYDTVVVDGGSHVTPAQATAVELADEVVAVTTPDVLALRGLRRSITAWEGLGVRRESDVRVLVNRVSRQNTVSADTVRQLTRAPVLSVGLPAMFRRLEPAVNARDPLALREEAWWRALRAIGTEIGVVQLDAAPRTAADELAVASKKRRGRKRGDRGGTSIELVAILPTALLIALMCWQIGIYGMTFVWSGSAANAAARALSVGDQPGPAARDAVPGSVARGLRVSPEGDDGGSTVRVEVRVPIIAPQLGTFPGTVGASRTVVREP